MFLGALKNRELIAELQKHDPEAFVLFVEDETAKTRGESSPLHHIRHVYTVTNGAPTDPNDTAIILSANIPLGMGEE